MILTLRQFLGNTDAGKEEWDLEPDFPSNVKLQNGKIKEKFWQNYGYLYGYYVKQIILSVHEVWLSKEYTECSICENYEVDRRATINLIKQVSVLNNNQYSQIELYQLRNMARWHNIIEFDGKGNQKSVINDKYNFQVASWYIIGDTLFVEKQNDTTTNNRDKTLFKVITEYYNNESVSAGMIIEKDDKCTYCPWSSIEKMSKYYTTNVAKAEKYPNCNILRIKLEDSRKEYNDIMGHTLRAYLNNHKGDEHIILIYNRNVIYCDASDVFENRYKKYGKCIVKDVIGGDLTVFEIDDPPSNTNDREKELHNIIGMMCSEDYQDRFKAEYLQLKMRYNKLHNMIVKYEAKKLDFKPKCDIELLKRQKAAMGQYLYYLEVRAEIEGVDING